MKSLDTLLRELKKFRDERDWMQFHNHKDMALSIVLEATEVLEHFQLKHMPGNTRVKLRKSWRMY